MKNLSRHTDLLCELVASSLIRGIQMGQISKLGWLVGLVKHVIWATFCFNNPDYRLIQMTPHPNYLGLASVFSISFGILQYGFLSV
jgi:hypothetical protein